MLYFSARDLLAVFARMEKQNASGLNSEDCHERKIALIKRSLLANIKKEMAATLKEKYDRS